MLTEAPHHTVVVGRRRFFAFVITAASTAVMPVASVFARQNIDVSVSPLMQLPGLVTHLQSAKTIGKAYLRRFPDEGEVQTLSRSIGLDGHTEFQRKTRHLPPVRSEQCLRSWVRDRIRADFTDGRVVILDGWILSQFEVRLCALIHLIT